jgi:hypothetical protein
MPQIKFDIFFSGQIMAGRDTTEVRDRVGKLFNAGPAQLDRLFSGDPIRVKAAVDQDTAIKYREAFLEVGALIEIRQVASEASVQTTQASAPSPPEHHPDDDVELLPPFTGSLIDCAPKVEPVPLPDTSALSLSPAGVDIEEAKETPPPQIDTSHLTAAAPNTGSLEDCHTPPEPAVIPETLDLDFADQG